MAQDERSRPQKRKRSVQRQLNQQVLELAEHEARLEESQLEEENQLEARILGNRRANLEMKEEMDSKRKKTLLTKLEDNVMAIQARFDFAAASLNQSIAAKIKEVEDSHTRRKIERKKELLKIDKEEKDLKDALDRSKQHYALYHTQDHTFLEDMVMAIQAQEPEDMQDQDQDMGEPEEEADQDQDDE